MSKRPMRKAAASRDLFAEDAPGQRARVTAELPAELRALWNALE